MSDKRDSVRQGAAPERDSVPERVRIGERVLSVAEDLVYGVIALLLIVTAILLLVGATRQLFTISGDEGIQGAAVEVLDDLLLVFIVVELLFAVRSTLVKRELLAEPFLLVGIIASIKEIVVLSVKAADQVGNNEPFTNQLREIGVLGVLVLLLGVTAWLLRLKEREPDEASGQSPTSPSS